MARTGAFDERAAEYDRWFDRHALAWAAELEAIERLLPRFSRGVEIGVGSGRFALPLGIRFGVEPSPAMARIARGRGIAVAEGVAEQLPLRDGCADLVLMVTAVSFFDDSRAAFREANRALSDGGHIVIGMLDGESEPAEAWRARRSNSPFFRDARLRGVGEVLDELAEAGFGRLRATQTLFAPDGDPARRPAVEEGHGRGFFAVARGVKRREWGMTPGG